jgi:hypothetical protein
MEVRDLFHGTNPDNILAMTREGLLRPNRDGKIYFSERRFHSVLMHGANMKRKATFAVKVRVTIPPTANAARAATAGVADTLFVTTTLPRKAEVLELGIREPRPTSVTTVKGKADIANFLSK